MVTLEFIKENMQRLKGEWAIEGDTLVRDWNFEDFSESMKFVNKVSEIAEKHQHHPTILVDYDHVRLSLTTHEHSDITEQDFLLAEEIDKVENESVDDKQ